MVIRNKEDSAVTLIGEDAAFEGKLESCGTVRIDGSFKGTISGDGTIVIGERGILECDIHVKNVIILGEIHGDVIAESRIDLRKSAKVSGNIEAPIITIDLGAVLQGACKTQQAKHVDDGGEEAAGSAKPA